MKKALIALLLFVIIGAIGLYLYIKPQAVVLNGYAARTVCTCHFIQGRSLEDIVSNDLNFSFFKYVSISIDEEEKSVKSSLLGISPKLAKVKSTALGCTLIYEEDDQELSFQPQPVIDTFEWNMDTLAGDYSDVLDQLFFGKQQENPFQTRAVVILKKDTIIYESYADGFDHTSPLLGWSMTKSVTSTFIGSLVSEGKLSLDQKGLFTIGAHQDITLDQLLDMRAGLQWEENYNSVSEATVMLFDSEDMVDYTLSLAKDPSMANTFEYSSGVTNLLVGVLRKQFESKSTYLDYPYEVLFRPLGMSTAFIETDESGNYVGSSYMYASARDWAKYGLLHLHYGKWGGEQVIDSAWIAHTFISDPLSGGGYGTQFWHNDNGALPDAPTDLIFADGFQGQRVFILPEEELVIVRLGLENMDFNTIIDSTLKIIKRNEHR